MEISRPRLLLLNQTMPIPRQLLPLPFVAARLPIRMNRDNSTADRTVRPFAIAGILVGMVALLGFDLTSPTTTRWHKAPSSAVHAVGSANNAAIAIAPVFACSVVVLAILLWLGCRRVISVFCLPPVVRVIAKNLSTIQSLLQSRLSISYHTGGLYGP